LGADTTEPELAAATRSPTSLQASTTEDQAVTIAVNIRDDKALVENGLAYMSIHPLSDPATTLHKESSSGNTGQTWEIRVTVPKDNGAGSSKGKYSLSALYIEDQTGNEAAYHNFDGYCSYSFTVK
jgi:hypothetical protein